MSRTLARAVEGYDRTMQYHRGSANVVADALSGRSYAVTSTNIQTHVKITNIRLESTLIDKVKAAQATYSELMNVEKKVQEGVILEARINEERKSQPSI